MNLFTRQFSNSVDILTNPGIRNDRFQDFFWILCVLNILDERFAIIVVVS